MNARALVLAREIRAREKELTELMTGIGQLNIDQRIKIKTLEMQQATSAMELADAVLAGSVKRQKRKYGSKWKREIWEDKISRTNMIGSIERAYEELERLWSDDRRDFRVAGTLVRAEHAIEKYQKNRRKPPRTVLWAVYHELAECLEAKR